MAVEYIPLNFAPGTTLLRAATTGKSVKVVGVVMSFSAAGTYKFTDGTIDLMGPISVLKDAQATQYFSSQPNVFFLETGDGKPLYIVTTGGTVTGFVAVVVERRRDFGAEWLHIHMYDAEANQIVHMVLNEASISIVHPYFPPTLDDWRYAAGLRSELHMTNGSIRYATEDWDSIRAAIGAKDIL